MNLKEIDKLDLLALAKLEVDVNTLLGEDAVLDLSYNEKRIYRLFAEGASDETCAEITGIKKGTVTKMRYTFWERAEYAVVFSLLAREMAKGMPEKERNSKERKPGEYHPVLDENGNIVDFAKDKYTLHQEGELALPHASVIILVGWLGPKNHELSFFIVDKAARVHTENALDGAIYPHAWETCGGHVEMQDLPDTPVIPGEPDAPNLWKNRPFSLLETFWRAAVREAREEIYLKRTELDFTRMHYLFTDHYDGPTIPAGRNIETSGVFLYCYNGKRENLASGDVRFRDSWRGAWLSDGMAKKEWIARSWTLTELMAEYQKPNHFCDALARCLKAMQENPALVEKMKDILRNCGQ